MKQILAFPSRGTIPADQPGYTRDPGNPYLFTMTWVPCELRVISSPCKGCPGGIAIQFCNHFDKPVEQNECNSCGGNPRKPQVHEEVLDMASEVLVSGG